MARDVILSTIIGSRAWGMERPDSDTDRFVVHAAPILEVLSGEDTSRPDQYQSELEDITFYEVKTVIDQIVKGNPNFIIGVLSPKTVLADDFGKKLQEVTRSNLARNIYPGIRGMVTGSRHRYELDKLLPHDPLAIKKCGQMLRFLDFGCRVLQGQSKLFEGVPPEYCTIENVDLGLKMLDQEYEKSKLPLIPTKADFKHLLLRKRRDQVLKSRYIQKGMTHTVPGEFV